MRIECKQHGRHLQFSSGNFKLKYPPPVLTFCIAHAPSQVAMCQLECHWYGHYSWHLRFPICHSYAMQCELPGPLPVAVPASAVLVPPSFICVPFTLLLQLLAICALQAATGRAELAVAQVLFVCKYY